MLSSINVLAGTNLTTGAIGLAVMIAGAVTAVAVVLGVLAYRRVGVIAVPAVVWQGGLVLAGVVLVWLLLERSDSRDLAAERRAVDARAAELTMRAIAQGSALACLDAGAGATVEAACEKALFSTPEGVAAAVAYVDARISQLAASLPLAEGDPAYQPLVERLRRALEADRFGLVAHVLATRGCKSTDCQDLKLVRDNTRIMANMRTGTFDSLVRVHALAWTPGGAPVNGLAAAPAPSAGAPPPADAQSASTAQPPAVLPATAAAAPGVVPEPPAPSSAPTHAPAPGKYDFPSAASIPAVSIMTPEPAGPPQAEAKPAPAPSPPARRAAPSQPARNQSARETAPRPSAPQQIVPQPPPNPQTSGTR